MRTNYAAVIVCAVVYWLLGASLVRSAIQQAVDGA